MLLFTIILKYFDHQIINFLKKFILKKILNFLFFNTLIFLKNIKKEVKKNYFRLKQVSNKSIYFIN